MTNQRWTLTDTQMGTTFKFPNNPSRMTSPNPVRNIHSVPVSSGVNASERNADVKQWTFSGVVYSSTDYQNLVAALASTNRNQLTDHLGRTYVIRIKSYSIVERQATRRLPWRFEYTVNAITYYRASGGFGQQPFGQGPFGQ